MPSDVPNRDLRRASTAWYAAAAVLLASGLVHVGVWIAAGGGPFDGPVSWRKPILFGLSAGATAASFGWIVARTRPRGWELTASLAAAAALVVEVALITLQTWRGVPSHFNHATPYDLAVHVAMDVLITVVTLYVLLLTIDVFGSFEARPETTLAVRAGLVLLVVSCLVGYAILVQGTSRAAAGLDPARVGPAGVPKFPHGVAIHALQLLPLLSAWLRHLGLDSAAIVRRVAAGAASQSLLLLFAVQQTVAGRARFDVTPPTATVLLLASILGLYSLVPFTGLGRSSAVESTSR